MSKNSSIVFLLLLFFVENGIIKAQSDSDSKKIIELLTKQNEALQHRLDVLEKMTDDVLWFQRVGDVAFVDKIFHTGPPLWKEKNPDGQGAGNPVKIWSYVFIPKNAVEGKKYPLMVLPHGGVHASFDTYYTHIIRELVTQGYIVVANDYRGSTGYGSSMYRKIDYGGLETEDVFASKQVMCESYDIVDSNRV
ncbi:MAG TPA: S9 family peptidase, partial [Bacteroidales bacterium]|nr:S9 family peptidase [Bacteroidales bacterium]